MKKSAYTRKCVNKYNRKPVLQFKLNGEFIKEWKTVGEVCREFGMDKSAILRCCKGKQKKSYHFIWKFKDETTNQFEIKEENKNENTSNAEESTKTLLEVKKID